MKENDLGFGQFFTFFYPTVKKRLIFFMYG